MEKTRQLIPAARQADLVVEEVPGETLIYDLKSHKAHCLNRTAALVWKNCDGKRTAEQVARRLERELGTPVSSEVVRLALSQLLRLHLLEEEGTTLEMMKVSRRDLVRKYLPAALVLPVILSIPVPTSAQAVSGCPAGQVICGTGCCPVGRVCCAGTCCPPGFGCFGGACLGD